MLVYTDDRLAQHIQKTTGNISHSRQIADLSAEWLNRDCGERNSLVLMGLQRTGKTTAMLQCARLFLNDSVYIMVQGQDTWEKLWDEIEACAAKGKNVFFIDEISLLPEFITNAGNFSDAARSMKFVFTGTASLSFAFAEQGPLVGRADYLDTTWIPWHEHSSLLGTVTIDNYIERGGIFASKAEKTFQTYLINSIAPNIWNSMQNAGYAALGDFRDYDLGSFSTMLNNVVNYDNHPFIVEAIRDWELHDLKMAKADSAGKAEGKLLRKMDAGYVLKKAQEALGMIEKKFWNMPFEKSFIPQFKSIMKQMRIFSPARVLTVADLAADDFMDRISGESDPFFKNEWLLLQPGLRWAQVNAIIGELKNALVYSAELPPGILREDVPDLMEIIFEGIRNRARGRILESVITYHAVEANPDKLVFTWRHLGEVDLVITGEGRIDLFEIKNSKDDDSNFFRHMSNKSVTEPLEARFGKVESRQVIYRGESSGKYINAADYLASLESEIRKSAHKTFLGDAGDGDGFSSPAERAASPGDSEAPARVSSTQGSCRAMRDGLH